MAEEPVPDISVVDEPETPVDQTPDRITAPEESIVKALSAGRVGSHDELLQRLANDGVKVDTAAFFSALGRLTAAGTVQSSPVPVSG